MSDDNPVLSTGVNDNAGHQCHAAQVTTQFAMHEDIDSMKAMVAGANPGQVLDVADAWKNIHEHLAGGPGSVKTDFDKAVAHVLQHWEGESADEFRKAAEKVSKAIGDCATYAHRTSVVMRNAGETLSDIKPKVEAIDKPSGWDKAMNALGDGFSRDSEAWKSEMSGNQGAKAALDKHHDTLSAGKEAQLEMAAHMETLAVTYSTQAKSMASWGDRKAVRTGDKDDFEPGGVAPVPVAVTPDGGGPGTAAGARAQSAVGGAKSSAPGTTGPVSATKVDGISGGTPNGAGRGGVSAGGAAGGITGGGGAAGTVGGVAGVPGGPGAVGQASGNRGIAGGRAGVGTGAGRAGAGGRVSGGLGSGGAGGAAGARGAGTAGGRGPLARHRGGMLDTPRAGTSPSKQGGQGLHSSRGGAMAGERGRGSGLLGRGAAGSNTQRQDGENRDGERPDYLVEDEETWMPEQREVNPPTIG